jgi:aspartate racemase
MDVTEGEIRLTNTASELPLSDQASQRWNKLRTCRKLAERGIRFVRPTDEERREINRIIMDELVYGVFRPDSVMYFQLAIRRMKDEGCDAVVLGCTEIPLIISNRNSPLPVLDSTRLLAWAALRRAVAEAHV